MIHIQICHSLKVNPRLSCAGHLNNTFYSKKIKSPLEINIVRPAHTKTMNLVLAQCGANRASDNALANVVEDGRRGIG